MEDSEDSGPSLLYLSAMNRGANLRRRARERYNVVLATGSSDLDELPLSPQESLQRTLSRLSSGGLTDDQVSSLDDDYLDDEAEHGAVALPAPASH